MSSSSSKPRPPLPKLSLSSTCIISDAALISGHPELTVTILDKAILHPVCNIVATYSSITIGEGAIVYEKATVGLLTPLTPLPPAPESSQSEKEDESRGNLPGSITIGKNAVIDIAANVHADIGEGTVVGAAATVHAGARVGKFCSISPRAEIPPSAILADYTIYISPTQRRVQNQDVLKHRSEAHEMTLDMLRRHIPMNREKWIAT